MADIDDYVGDLISGAGTATNTSIVSTRVTANTNIRSATPASIPSTGITTTELTCSGDAVITGNLTVNGTTSTVNSTTVTVDDKNIELGAVASPTDTTADGGGITLKGATDKTITWLNSDDRWHFNQGVDFDGDIYLSPTVITTAHVVASGSLRVRCSDALWIGDDGADSVRIGRTNTAAAKVHIRSGTDSDLVVAGSKVGIGTDSPAEMLHLKSSEWTKPELLIENTNDDQFSSVLRFYKSTTDEAASDQVGLIIWTGKDAADTDANMAWIVGKAGTVDSGAEEGALHFGVATEGVASYSTLSMVGTGDAGKSYALFGDPWQSAHTTHVGIGVVAPSVALEIDGDVKLSPSAISTAHITTAGSLRIRAENSLYIGDDGADAVRIGRTNTALAPVHIRSGGDNDLVVKGGKVGINDDAPSHELDVAGDINLTGGLSFDDGTAVTSIDTDLTSVSGSDDTLASAKSIKTYVDTKVTAEDLDIACDGGTGSIDLDSETLTINGGAGIITAITGNTVAIAANAAQTHVTSLGTLSALAVSGNVTLTNSRLQLGTPGVAGGSNQVHIVDSTASGPSYAPTPTMVLEDDTRPGIQIVGSANNIGLLQFGDNDSSNPGEMYYDHSEDKFNFRTAGTVRLTLDSSGNLNCTGEVQAAKIAFTDGDDAITIADGGGITAEAGITSTAAANSFGASSFSGVVSLSDGSAAAPALTNTGDVNCGLYFSAADTLAFTAGGTAQVTFKDGAVSPVTDSDVDLGTSSFYWKDAYIDTVTTTGNVTVAGDLEVNGSTATFDCTLVMDAGRGLVFEGATDDGYETTVNATDPTQDNTVLLPDIAQCTLATVDSGSVHDSNSAIDPLTSITFVDSSGGSIALGLADGSVAGQRKRVASVGGGNNCVVTPANFAGYTSMTLDTQGEWVDLVWYDGNWIHMNNSACLSASLAVTFS